MTSVTQTLKSVGPKLVPFFKTVAVYFVLLNPTERASPMVALWKCLPVVSLVLFVYLHGISLANEHAFPRKVLAGLLFSCLGDAFLVWDHTFLHGMASFGIGHTFYISAFGFRPLNLPLGLFLYGLGCLVVSFWLPQLETWFAVCVAFYTMLLITTAWRAMVRVRSRQDLWLWTNLCACAGSLLFLASDTVLGFHKFHRPIPHAQHLIMSTYYAAQFGLALSVVDWRAAHHPSTAPQPTEKTPLEPKTPAAAPGQPRRRLLS